MKIPTKQNNTKHTAIAAGALAMIMGIATPTVALAHGGDRSDRGGSWDRNDRRSSHQQRDWNRGNTTHRGQATLADQTKNQANRSYDRHHGDTQHAAHDKPRWTWSWWNNLSATDFENRNAKALQNLDDYTQKYSLNIENGNELRAAVEANAASVSENLTALQTLRDSIGDPRSATSEQREALKAQTVATFGVYYDYHVSLYEYKAAIKTAADEAGVKNKMNVWS